MAADAETDSQNSLQSVVTKLPQNLTPAFQSNLVFFECLGQGRRRCRGAGLASFDARFIEIPDDIYADDAQSSEKADIILDYVRTRLPNKIDFKGRIM